MQMICQMATLHANFSFKSSEHKISKWLCCEVSHELFANLDCSMDVIKMKGDYFISRYKVEIFAPDL